MSVTVGGPSAPISIAVNYLGTSGTLVVQSDMGYTAALAAINTQLVGTGAGDIIPPPASGQSLNLVLVGSDSAQTIWTSSSASTLLQVTSTNVAEQSSSFAGTRAGPFQLIIVLPNTLEINATDPSTGVVDVLWWIPPAGSTAANTTPAAILTEATGKVQSLQSNLFPATSPFKFLDSVLTWILGVESNIISSSLSIDAANTTKLNAFLNGTGPTTTLPSITVSISRSLLYIPVATGSWQTSALGAIGGIGGVAASVGLGSLVKAWLPS